jgi:nucleoside 2-deoxyribosyltransferase
MIKVYIAHPLEARDAPPGSPWADMEANVERYLKFCAAFSNAGFTVVSWVHHYMMHVRGLTKGDAAYYLERDADLVRASDVLVVAGPPEVSSGLRYEIEVARAAGVPVIKTASLLRRNTERLQKAPHYLRGIVREALVSQVMP